MKIYSFSMPEEWAQELDEIVKKSKTPTNRSVLLRDAIYTYLNNKP